jgi:hypothetical protein
VISVHQGLSVAFTAPFWAAIATEYPWCTQKAKKNERRSAALTGHGRLDSTIALRPGLDSDVWPRYNQTGIREWQDTCVRASLAQTSAAVHLPDISKPRPRIKHTEKMHSEADKEEDARCVR